ncbi:MAG TPA: hypothetical protein VIV12_08165 [Streptosporangiaceae bacterium]
MPVLYLSLPQPGPAPRAVNMTCHPPPRPAPGASLPLAPGNVLTRLPTTELPRLERSW